MEAKLKQLKCKDLFDLILTVPRDYQNLSLIDSLSSLPKKGVIEVQILSHHKTPKLLKIQADLLLFHRKIEITIFHPKPFHTSIFPIGKTLYLYGVLQQNFSLEIIQPKIIKSFGKIYPIFPKKPIKNDELITLTQTLITQESLQAINLPNEVIQNILPIFHPTLSFVQYYEKYKTFPQETLQALKYVEIFSYLQKMQQKKKDFQCKFQCNGDYQEFISSLPFKLTQGQMEAIYSIAQDLKRPIASKRMIMGDVGCGKTIVILCSVMIAYPYKSILMAPTTILATQLFEEAKKFLPPYIKIGLFISESSKKQNFNDYDFVIGTQALLHRDETLQDFALVMSDEQHRFGTMQRHKLEKLATQEGKKPHILQFSATPIPRTMAMLQADLISYTFITDTPFKKDIETKVIKKSDFSTLLQHIKNEIANNHQIAIVYPLVEESENFAYTSLKEAESYWFKHFEGVYSTNGSDKNKDEVIAEFRDKGSILLSTTVIEVGISLPRLSTIVIVGAERMGLATLHQLRGRVSRNGLKGYCFLFTYQQNSQRLEEFSKTNNGFEIAELDLNYRKSGDLLEGKNQSGAEFIFFDPKQDLKVLQKVKNSQSFLKDRYNARLLNKK